MPFLGHKMKKWIPAAVILALACFATFYPEPRTARYLDHQNAGDSASIKRDYLEAEKQYKEALTIAEEDGPNNFLVQTAFHYLGINYLAQKKYAEAEDAYQNQIKVAENLNGPDSAELLSPLSDITLLYLNQKRFQDAEKQNQRALSIAARVP